MKRFSLVLAVAALALAAPAGAHHSFAMFDQTQIWSWTGTVVEYHWRQPHIHIIGNLVGQGARQPGHGIGLHQNTIAGVARADGGT